MSKYATIYHKIWTDKKFKNLSSDSKILFIYLLSNDNMNISGIIEINSDVVNLILPTMKGFNEHIKELVNASLIKYDEKENLLWVINKFKFTYIKSGSVIMGCIKELNHLEHGFKKEFLEKYKDIIKPYINLVNGYVEQEEILTEDQVLNFVKINWGKERIKKFYQDRGYNEQKIDQIVGKVL